MHKNEKEGNGGSVDPPPALKWPIFFISLTKKFCNRKKEVSREKNRFSSYGLWKLNIFGKCWRKNVFQKG